jgi:hypothetical protein
MGKRILITQSNYIPWKGYFDSINQCDEMVIYDDMQYTKRDWRNRNKIKTPQGLKWLTIPVEVKGKYFQKINETLVSDPNWGESHLKQLEQNYKKAPFFDETMAQLEDYFLKNEEKRLTYINQILIEKINEILEIKTTILRSEDFELHEDKTQRLVDICVARKATEYLTGPAAKAYMDEEAFRSQGIEVIYADYNYGQYEQLHGAFEHGVTVLDAIFSVGPKFDLILNKS